MNYNFDKLTDRRGSNSFKWDSRSDIPADTIPMWVADMDFEAAPAIRAALQRRVDHGIFGYTFVPDAYYEAITRWFDTRHSWHIDPWQVIYTPGVIPALSAIIKALTKPGEKILITAPVYNHFFSSIRNNGCIASESPLILDGNSYRIDFDDFEKRASEPDCTMFILCNPHNPAGRVWSTDELRRMDEICTKHGVMIISDEIHCELVYAPYKYTPFATIASGEWISCVSPSKAFNTAGLHIANIICSNEQLKAKVDRAVNDNEVCDVNPFGVDALIAAYNESGAWLDEAIEYIHGNYELLKSEFEAKAPAFAVVRLEGTYLAWVDCRSLGMPSEQLEEWLIQNAHVWINAGVMYGKDGEGFIRINLACARERLQVALERLLPTLVALQQKK